MTKSMKGQHLKLVLLFSPYQSRNQFFKVYLLAHNSVIKS